MEQTPSLRVNCKFGLRVKYEKKNYREYFRYAHQVVKMLSEFHMSTQTPGDRMEPPELNNPN